MNVAHCFQRQAELTVSVMMKIWYLIWSKHDYCARTQTNGSQPGLVKSSGHNAKVTKINLQNAIVWTMRNLEKQAGLTDCARWLAMLCINCINRQNVETTTSSVMMILWYLTHWCLSYLHQSKQCPTSDKNNTCNCFSLILFRGIQAELAVSVMIRIWYLAYCKHDNRARMQTIGLWPRLDNSSGCCLKIIQTNSQYSAAMTKNSLQVNVLAMLNSRGKENAKYN
jgi:hypothetical protein